MLPRRAWIAAGAMLAFVVTGHAAAGTPVPGSPYSSFGGGGLNGGTLYTSFGSGALSDDRAHEIISLPTGKLVAVGEARLNGQDTDFALAAYEPSSGAADESGFSGDGLQQTDFNGGDDVALGAAVAPDNKFVVVGTAETSEASNRFRFAVARYRASGALDRSFGGDGLVTTRIRNGTVEEVAGEAVVRRGKLTAAGYSTTGSDSRFALARYNPDGSLDQSFGGDGRVLTGFPGSEGTSRAWSIAAQGRRVVVAGAAFQPGSLDDDFALARYRRDGSLDPAFDGDGRVTTDIDSGSVPDVARDVVVDPDGGIIAGGLSADTTDEFAIARYATNGGVQSHEVVGFAAGEFEVINALVLQPSGKLLAAGESDDRFAVFRLLANGNIDTGFSPDAPAGIAYTDFSGDDDGAQGMTLAGLAPEQDKAARGAPVQEQGDPVLAGFTDNDNLGYDFALARYHGD